MAFMYTDSGVAAAIFLALFTLVLPFTIVTVFKHGFKSFYTVTIFSAVVRIASQVCAVVFAVVGFAHQNWLIAYLILGAEGYFFLIMCMFHVLITGQVKKYGYSWLTKYGVYGDVKDQIAMGNKSKIATRSWASLYRTILVPSNILIIVGGAILSGISADDLRNESTEVLVAKILRAIGQLIFLLLTVVLIFLAIVTYFRDNVRNWGLKSVLAAAPFILIRGIFGLLSIFINKMDYFDMANYGTFGISKDLVIFEYILGTTMELCCLLCILLNYFDNEVPNFNDVDSFTKDDLMSLT